MRAGGVLTMGSSSRCRRRPNRGRSREWEALTQPPPPDNSGRKKAVERLPQALPHPPEQERDPPARVPPPERPQRALEVLDRLGHLAPLERQLAEPQLDGGPLQRPRRDLQRCH